MFLPELLTDWRQDLTTYVRGSKFWRLFQNGSHFDRSEWSYVHLSDALRLILLEKYGGFYLDSDIVTFRPLHCLRNAASYLNEVPHIENGVVRPFEPLLARTSTTSLS